MATADGPAPETPQSDSDQIGGFFDDDAPVFENTYFLFFFQISKNMTFYVFFEMAFQKNVKSHKSIKFAECL